MSYNVFDDELDVERELQHPGYSVGGTILGDRIGVEQLGATLYPDSAKVGFGSRGSSWRIFRDDPSLDYWEGE